MGVLKRDYLVLILLVSFLSIIQRVDAICSTTPAPIDVMFLIESSPVNLGVPTQLGFKKSSEYLLFRFDPSIDKANVMSYDNDIDFISSFTSNFNSVNTSIYATDFNGGYPEINFSLNAAFDYFISNARPDSSKSIVIVTSGDWNTTTYHQNFNRALTLNIPVYVIMPSLSCNSFFPCIHPGGTVRFNALATLAGFSGGYIVVDPSYTQLDTMYERIYNQSCDTIPPKVDFGVGTEEDNAIFDRDFIFANVSVIEINPANITFSLYRENFLIRQDTYSLPGDLSANLSVNFTNLGPGLYFYNVSVTDRANNVNQTSTRQINLTKQKNPVLLVHGFCSGYDNTWGINNKENWDLIDFGNILVNRGFKVYSIDFPKPTNRQVVSYVPDLAAKIKQIKEETGADKVDVVAHSMGGLITRWYIQKTPSLPNKEKDIGQLIMIATPNHGSWISTKYEWTTPGVFGSVNCVAGGGYLAGKNAATDMNPKSPFLSQLNYNEPGFDINTWILKEEINGGSFGVKYSTIGGTGGKTDVFEAKIKASEGGYILKSSSQLLGDQIVPLHSVKLKGIGCNQYTNPYPLLEKGHTMIHENIDVLNKVVEILNNPFLNQGDNCITTHNSPTSTLIQEIFDNISQGQEKIYPIFVDYSAANLSLGVVWGSEANELGLNLIDPNGNLITPFSMGINYSGFALGKLYNIENPTPGEWKINITGYNVSSGSEIFFAGGSYESDIIFFIQDESNNYSKTPGQPLNIVALFFNDTEFTNPILNANIQATVIKPDNTSENIILYDDGLHNDFNASDGAYGNSYLNTTVHGVYDVRAIANATVDSNKSILRYATQLFWVETYPDLMLNQSSFNLNSTILPNENDKLNISVTVFNLGDNKATNVTVFLFDEVNGSTVDINSSGILIPEINAGSNVNVTFEWNGTTPIGNHTIIAAVNTFDSLEKSYENNNANITLTITPVSNTIASCRDIDVIGSYNLSGNILYNNNLYCIKISNNNTIINCNGYSISGIGSGEGIKIINSKNVIVKNCRVVGFALGFNLTNSNNNTIFNNIISNTKNAVDNGFNIWNTNNWSDYFGNDTNGDGIGDQNIPYNSGGYISNGGDFLPLVPVNRPPVITKTTPPNSYLEYNLPVNIVFTENSSDPDKDPLYYNWFVNSNLVTNTQNLSYNFLQVRSYNVTFSVYDIHNAFSQNIVSWIVNVTSNKTGGTGDSGTGGGSPLFSKGGSPFIKKKVSEIIT